MKQLIAQRISNPGNGFTWLWEFLGWQRTKVKVSRDHFLVKNDRTSPRSNFDPDRLDSIQFCNFKTFSPIKDRLLDQFNKISASPRPSNGWSLPKKHYYNLLQF